MTPVLEWPSFIAGIALACLHGADTNTARIVWLVIMLLCVLWVKWIEYCREDRMEKAIGKLCPKCKKETLDLLVD